MEKYDLVEKYYNNKEYEKAYKQYFEYAKNGDIYSQKMVGYMLNKGLGVVKNTTKAFDWYKKAAVIDAEAQYIYAWYCLEQKKEQDGIKYLINAAKNNYSPASYDLGGIYFFGIYSLPKDIDKAIKFYENAVLNGHVKAIDDLLKAKKMKDGFFKTILYLLQNIFKFYKNMNLSLISRP